MRYRVILSFLALLLLASCAGTSGPEPASIGADDVEKMVLYSSDGGQEVIQGNDRRFAGLLKELLATLTKFNLQAGCVFSEDQISTIEQEERVIELALVGLRRLTIGQQIPKDERDSIPTDGRGFRMLEVKAALFVLSGEYRGHLFLPSESEPPMWGCWAAERKKQIDTSWIQTVEDALGQ